MDYEFEKGSKLMDIDSAIAGLQPGHFVLVKIDSEKIDAVQCKKTENDYLLEILTRDGTAGVFDGNRILQRKNLDWLECCRIFHQVIKNGTFFRQAFKDVTESEWRKRRGGD